MNKYEKEAESVLGHRGRMISGSKGHYVYKNPKHITVFNANLIIGVDKNSRKIWFGDVDLTTEHDKVAKLAQKLNQQVYVLRESDARFDNEKNPKLERYVAFWTPKGDVVFNPELKIAEKNGKFLYNYPKVKPKKEPSRFENREKDFKPIPLPPMSKFATKRQSPILTWQKAVAKQLNVKDLENVFDNLYVTGSCQDALLKLQKDYYRKVHKLTGYYLQKEVGWDIFSIPCCLADQNLDPTWSKKNGVYMIKSKKAGK